MTVIEVFLLVGGLALLAGGFLLAWCLFCLAEKVGVLAAKPASNQRQLELDTRLSATERKLTECTDLLADTAKLLDMVIDAQDGLEDEVWGQVANDGLLSRVNALEKAVYGDAEEEVYFPTLSLPRRLDFVESELWSEDGDGRVDRVEQVEQRLKEAGWTVTDDPADLFKVEDDSPPLGTYYGEHLQGKREERCLAGQCHPSDCDREQCPHRTAEYTVTPFNGVLSEFDGKKWNLSFTGAGVEWDSLLLQGQVELPCCERAENEKATADLVDRLNKGEVLYGLEVVDGKLQQKPMDEDQSQGLSYG